MKTVGVEGTTRTNHVHSMAHGTNFVHSMAHGISTIGQICPK
jgi:hypothetical protein